MLISLKKTAVAVAALAVMVSSLAACGSDSATDDPASGGISATEPSASEAWTRPADAGANSAVYMVIKGGEEDDALVSVMASNVAESAGIHETSAGEEMSEADSMTGGSMADGTADEMTEDDSGHSQKEAGAQNDMIDKELAQSDDDAAALDGEMDDSDGDTGHGDGSDDTDMNSGGGLMSMKAVDSIAVPKGSTVTLEPGGLHIMLNSINDAFAVGDSFEIVLDFESGLQRTVDVEVRDS